MKTVCFLVTYLGSGGAENYLLRYLQHNNTIRPVVICKSGTKGILEEDYLKANATIITIKGGYFNVFSWIKAFRIFKKFKPEAVCDFTGNFAGIFMLIAWLANVPKRIALYRRSSHAFSPSLLNKIYDRFVNMLVAKFATNILANSLSGLNFFHPGRSIEDKRFKVIFNGLDDKIFVSTVSKAEMRDELGIPQGAFVVGHTGRLNVAKNHPTMLKVAERLIEKYDDIYFVFCGKDTETLRSSANSDKLNKHLILLGYRSDVNRVLNAFDLYFFPSITEGQPNALIEAMITGLPFVASNIGAIQEVAPSQLLDNLFDTYDVEGFAKKIEEAYLNRQTLNDMSCREFATNQFNAETNFKKFSELL